MNDFRIRTGNCETILLFSSTFKSPIKNHDKTAGIDTNETRLTMQIILADDDEDDRDLFKEALQEISIKTNLEVEKDGKSLIEFLNRRSVLPDLIFLDLNMPHKSGKDCLAEIRKDERLKNIPVLIYSTSSLPKDIEDTFQLGANLYVKKPASFNELTDYLNELLTMDWNKHKPHVMRNQYFFMIKK